MKTSDLTGAALDWAVARCEGKQVAKLSANGVYVEVLAVDCDALLGRDFFSPSVSWAQGGPIMERIKGLIQKTWLDTSRPELQCECHIHNYEGDWIQFGPAPLIAAMRCYVASKLGDEVDIPEEFIEDNNDTWRAAQQAELSVRLEREKFEAWINHPIALERFSGSSVVAEFYVREDVQMQWEAWEAALRYNVNS